MNQIFVTNCINKKIYFLFLIIFLAACASTTPKKSSPSVLLKQSLQQFQNKNYEDVKTLTKTILEDYPDSRERVMAQLLLADVDYVQENYEEAKFNYSRFLELHPANPKAPHALYYRAMSYYNLIDLATRDQTSTQNALEEFELLIKDHPDSPYTKRALEKKKKCLSSLANNLLEIGRFYFRTNAYQSAISRFKSLIETYPDEPHKKEEALFYLGESYFLEQNNPNAKIYYKQLLQEYPRSKYRKEARLRLRSIRVP